MSQYDKPHIPEKCRNGLAVANQDKALARYSEDPSPILNRLREGESVRELTESLGISRAAFYEWALRNCQDQFLAISAGRSLSRIDQAEQDLDDAEDQVAVSKARESARLAQWNLERASRRIYGAAKEDSASVVVQVLVQRDGEPHTSVIEQPRT